MSNEVQDASDIDRRSFVKKAVVLAAVAGGCGCCGGLDQALGDTLGAELADPTTQPTSGLDVGLLSDYSKDGIVDKFEVPNKVLIIRTDGMLFAASSRCTHRNCPVHKRPDNSLYCRCHGSVFTIHGTVDQGPAKTSLPRFAIRLSDAKHVIVDKTKQFAEAQWDDPASFIKVS